MGTGIWPLFVEESYVLYLEFEDIWLVTSCFSPQLLQMGAAEPEGEDFAEEKEGRWRILVMA